MPNIDRELAQHIRTSLILTTICCVGRSKVYVQPYMARIIDVLICKKAVLALLFDVQQGKEYAISNIERALVQHLRNTLILTTIFCVRSKFYIQQNLTWIVQIWENPPCGMNALLAQCTFIVSEVEKYQTSVFVIFMCKTFLLSVTGGYGS